MGLFERLLENENAEIDICLSGIYGVAVGWIWFIRLRETEIEFSACETGAGMVWTKRIEGRSKGFER